jgi:hypothetical protein
MLFVERRVLDAGEVDSLARLATRPKGIDMVPNMYTVILECQREYQERLREPRPGGVAAGVHRSTPASPVRLTIVPHRAAGWLLVRRLLKAAVRQPAGRPPLGIDPGPAASSPTS